ncbi:MAG: hypothetical protein HN844_00920 [Planctomycetes bacterium]|nr:hypothetical protein [Planctomycetota bacterium]MBT7317761.1 hypothetical protein [Planctomycetota bacterium]
MSQNYASFKQLQAIQNTVESNESKPPLQTKLERVPPRGFQMATGQGPQRRKSVLIINGDNALGESLGKAFLSCGLVPEFLPQETTTAPPARLQIAAIAVVLKGDHLDAELVLPWLNLIAGFGPLPPGRLFLISPCGHESLRNSTTLIHEATFPSKDLLEAWSAIIPNPANQIITIKLWPKYISNSHEMGNLETAISLGMQIKYGETAHFAATLDLKATRAADKRIAGMKSESVHSQAAASPKVDKLAYHSQKLIPETTHKANQIIEDGVRAADTPLTWQPYIAILFLLLVLFFNSL